MRDRAEPTPFATSNGWRITYTPNIHMYVHGLRAVKGDIALDVPCETTPEGWVGIWPYRLQLAPALSHDLLAGLHEWARSSGLKFRLYRTPDAWEIDTARAPLLRNAILIILLLCALAWWSQ